MAHEYTVGRPPPSLLHFYQTTAYDNLTIARVKGARREVRRELAEVSRAVLDLHRRDVPHASPGCPLCTALGRLGRGQPG